MVTLINWKPCESRTMVANPYLVLNFFRNYHVSKLDVYHLELPMPPFQNISITTRRSLATPI